MNDTYFNDTDTFNITVSFLSKMKGEFDKDNPIVCLIGDKEQYKRWDIVLTDMGFITLDGINPAFRTIKDLDKRYQHQYWYNKILISDLVFVLTHNEIIDDFTEKQIRYASDLGKRAFFYQTYK